MPKYLVGDPSSRLEERNFFISTADTAQIAIDRYMRTVVIQANSLIRYLCGKSPNASFAESFWIQTEAEVQAFHDNGDILIDDEEFRRRVRVFFGEHQDYADIYIGQYFSDSDACDPDSFSDEMRLYIVYNSNWTSVEAIPLDEIKEL